MQQAEEVSMQGINCSYNGVKPDEYLQFRPLVCGDDTTVSCQTLAEHTMLNNEFGDIKI